MNRNTESHFALNPTNIDISRSTFDRSSSHKTTFNVGDIIPFYVDEVLPGDTFNVNTSKVVRMQTLITPMMDNLYLDTYFFFVPNRLVWSHWKEFNGENTASAWVPQATYEVPQIVPPSGGWNIGTIADYMGIPTGVDGLSVNALPFRAYALIMNEWFRDENLCDPLNIPVDETTVTGVNTGTFVSDVAKGGLPYKAAKYHDYFTSCLPAPQKGPDVAIPVASSSFELSGNAPVYSLTDKHKVADYPKDNVGTMAGMYFYNSDSTYPRAGYAFTDNFMSTTSQQIKIQNTLQDRTALVPFNLWTSLDGVTGDISSGVSATINQLRLAFQIQKMYEKDARGGTRYIEILKSHFGVTSPDARLQRPEYLGGNRIPITVNQVIQNSDTTATSPMGNVAGMSLTTDVHNDFTKSFTEHGFVIGVMVSRYDHTYQQGIERMWSRKDRFDYYWPVFANIGEQAVLNKEIFAQGSSQVNPVTGKAYDEEVFGYQEAWADYRYKPNRVSGEMRSSATTSLDSWHLADDYAALPSLSDSWIAEDGDTVDRVLAVSQRVSNQLFADIFVRNRTTRPMPLYSVPGLIDHH